MAFLALPRALGLGKLVAIHGLSRSSLVHVHQRQPAMGFQWFMVVVCPPAIHAVPVADPPLVSPRSLNPLFFDDCCQPHQLAPLATQWVTDKAVPPGSTPSSSWIHFLTMGRVGLGVLFGLKNEEAQLAHQGVQDPPLCNGNDDLLRSDHLPRGLFPGPQVEVSSWETHRQPSRVPYPSSFHVVTEGWRRSTTRHRSEGGRRARRSIDYHNPSAQVPGLRKSEQGGIEKRHDQGV